MTLYDSDFYAWTQDQAGRLRRLAGQRSNVDLDLGNLLEEVESMGSEQAEAVESGLSRIIEHLLKLEHSPAVQPRRKWVESVLQHRDLVARKLKRNPSLAGKASLEELSAEAWKSGRNLAVRSLALYGEADAARAVPADCPYSGEQLLDEDWFPENRHGITD